jgi:peptide methionine sulfoxide reductase msrA/msrB
MEVKKAYYAGGCFWGVEHLFQSKAGVVDAVSGYMGGDLNNPTYQDVLTGRTGHLEAVEISYDPAIVSYEELTKYFFEIHDPTQGNGQGPDIGAQYLSAVFYSSQEEQEIAAELVATLKGKGYQVVTQLMPAETFWKAEDYHQDYYVKKNQQPYCHFYQKKF